MQEVCDKISKKIFELKICAKYRAGTRWFFADEQELENAGGL
jgi:hypothetical protein